MRRYAITRYAHEMSECVFRNPSTRRDFLVYGAAAANTDPYNIKRPAEVYYSDSLSDAKSMADLLVTEHPGSIVCIAVVDRVYMSEKPARVEKTISMFSDKGLLPSGETA